MPLATDLTFLHLFQGHFGQSGQNLQYYDPTYTTWYVINNIYQSKRSKPFNPEYELDFIRKEIRQNSSEAHEQRKKNWYTKYQFSCELKPTGF